MATTGKLSALVTFTVLASIASASAVKTAIARRPPTGGLSTLLEDPFFNTFGSFGALSALPRFGELLGPAASGGLMKMDVKESDTSIEVHCDVPGFAKEEVTVEVDGDNVLHISAEHKDEKEEGEKDERGLWKYHRIERSSARQYRSVKLPVSANTAGIAAECQDGVLSVSIPKIATVGEAESRRRIAVN